jgi:hypothetical protein
MEESIEKLKLELLNRYENVVYIKPANIPTAFSITPIQELPESQRIFDESIEDILAIIEDYGFNYKPPHPKSSGHGIYDFIFVYG